MGEDFSYLYHLSEHPCCRHKEAKLKCNDLDWSVWIGLNEKTQLYCITIYCLNPLGIRVNTRTTCSTDTGRARVKVRGVHFFGIHAKELASTHLLFVSSVSSFQSDFVSVKWRGTDSSIARGLGEGAWGHW